MFTALNGLLHICCQSEGAVHCIEVSDWEVSCLSGSNWIPSESHYSIMKQCHTLTRRPATSCTRPSTIMLTIQVDVKTITLNLWYKYAYLNIPVVVVFLRDFICEDRYIYAGDLYL